MVTTVFGPPRRVPGTAPETTGGRTVLVIVRIHFSTIFGRTLPHGKITNLRLLGTSGITVKVFQTGDAGVASKQPKQRPRKDRGYERTWKTTRGAVIARSKTGMDYSKKPKALEAARAVFLADYNFVWRTRKPHSGRLCQPRKYHVRVAIWLSGCIARFPSAAVMPWAQKNNAPLNCWFSIGSTADRSGARDQPRSGGDPMRLETSS